MDPLIFTDLSEETNVNFNQCYRKEGVHNRYFSVATARDPNQAPTPVVQGAIWWAQDGQGAACFSYTWFKCPCTGNKCQTPCCCDITLICQM